MEQLHHSHGRRARLRRPRAPTTSTPAARAGRPDRDRTSQDHHVEGLPFGTRGGMLVDRVVESICVVELCQERQPGGR